MRRKFLVPIDPTNINPRLIRKYITNLEADEVWAQTKTPPFKPVRVPSQKKKWTKAGVWSLISHIIP